jgi:hypothetical protein
MTKTLIEEKAMTDKRMMVAKIINPYANWDALKGFDDSRFQYDRNVALERADAILAALSPPASETGDAVEWVADVLKGIDVARGRLAPLMKQGEDYIWRPAQAAFEALGNARAAIAATPADGTALLRRLAEHTNWELSQSSWDEPFEWQVHSVNGGRNDREWTLLGSGNSPAEALDAALNKGGA